MTLDIRGCLIAGVRATIVRDALRRFVHCMFDHLLLADACKISERKSREVMNYLIGESYIQRVAVPFRQAAIPLYELTNKGMRFVNASAMRRFDRSKADKIILDFMKRVREVNSDPHFLFKVAGAIVYGSYVRGEQTLGDVDIAYELTRKCSDPKRYDRMAKERVAAARAKGRNLDWYMDELFWPETETRLRLKSRTAGLILHPIEDFIRMPKHDNFSYRVLLGDAEHIASRVRAAADRTPPK